MENNTTAPSSSLHPVLWVAGISVTLLSVVGIASLTGLLPTKSAPQAPLVAEAPAAPPPATVPAATATPATAPAPAATQPAAAVPAARQKVAKRKSEPDKATGPIAATPPPAGAGVPPDYVPSAASAAQPVAPPCRNCGVVADVRQVTHEGQGTGLGAIAGGVVGGALGSNVGRGNGRTLATIAGAVGGGLLGNQVEKSQRETVSYQISVRMDDGTTQVIDASTTPSWRIGDQVKLLNGGLVAR